MVCLVDHEPVRAAGPHPHGAQMWQELREIRRTVREWDAEQARIRVHVRVAQHRHDLGDAGWALRVANGDQHLQVHIIAFRIDYTDLIEMFGEALDETGGE